MDARKQSSTGQPMLFLMTLEADHVTGAAGLTPTVTLSKNGGAFAAAAGAVTGIGSGWYSLAGNATDRDTLGELALHASAATADPADQRYVIVPWDPFDANQGLANLDATVGSRESEASASTRATTDQTEHDATQAAIAAIPTDKAGYSLTAGERTAIATALLDLVDAIETGISPRAALRISLAALAGKLSGAATTAVAIRNVGDTKDRISATVDADGNRTSVTVDGA